jgi:hypothetical protein
MKSVEPVFDFPEDFYPAGSGASETDIRALEDTIARQSSELNLRLTEILDLYNIQARQTDALQVAREEIERLKRTVSELRNAMAEQGTAAVANQEEIKRLKKDRASLSTQRALALLETETMADRMHAMQATLNAGGANAASALAQIGNLNSELAAAMVERFKLVATVHGEIETLQSENVLLGRQGQERGSKDHEPGDARKTSRRGSAEARHAHPGSGDVARKRARGCRTKNSSAKRRAKALPVVANVISASPHQRPFKRPPSRLSDTPVM